MSLIFIDTDNTNPKEKTFEAKLAGAESSALEKKMQDTVVKTLSKEPAFTTQKIKDAKGYTIRLKLAKLEVAGRETKCSLSGEIVEYPKITYGRSGAGSKMLTTSLTGSAAASGSFAAVDCVEAITESIVKKAVPIMRMDMSNNR